MLLNKNYSIQFGARELSFNIGEIAKQAHGSVVVSYGDTTVLCAVTVGDESTEERDFLPLTVNYVAKFYAVGKIPGGYLKREGRPSNSEILTSRIIDRSLRPLFAKGFTRDIQLSCTLLSYEKSGDHEVAALIGSVLACGLAGLPLQEVMAGCRVGYVNKELILNPDPSIENNKLDLFVSATRSSIFMVESEADQLSEKEMLSALNFAKDSVQDVISLIEKIISEHGKPKIDFVVPDYSDLYNTIKPAYKSKIEDAYKIVHKQERESAIKSLKKEITLQYATEDVSKVSIGSVLYMIEKEIVKRSIFESSERIDGRGLDEIRELSADTNVLPQNVVHGSALFTRGETQALVITTLGGSLDEQMINNVTDISKKETFMLHYNFPPYAVGDSNSQRPTSRREIGHGNLAYRALKCVLPEKEDFPYTIRVVSEITESNGSSSMATVCGSTLSLLATGVPLKAPVSGIAMGLIKEGKDFAVLTDIMGDEDHLGDMDFKVAKTQEGITALQMDIKIAGIDLEIMSVAIDKASKACNEILEFINSTLDKPMSLGNAIPKIEEVTIPIKKIAELIGKSGANIKAICEATESKIDIDQEGIVKIFAPDTEKMEMAKQMIQEAIIDIQPGEIYEGEVSKIMPFGLLITLPGGKSGMVHIGEIADEHVDDIRDYAEEGDMVTVKVIGFDDRRRIKLSIKRVNEN